MSNLRDYEKRIYSQFGEDGIIEEVLRRISLANSLDSWCVEFGAWDGVHLSNSCYLIREKNYSAVLVEGSAKRFKTLCKNFPQPHVHKLCRFISFEGSCSLDNVLSETPLPNDFDFLSIDVDGVDYFILDSIQVYRPKVICIEFNPTIPMEVDFVQERDFSCKHGSSAKAILRLAETKGYSPVAMTITNLIFVRNDLFDSVLDKKQSISELYHSSDNPVYLFSGYDGTILSNQDYLPLLCHGVRVPVSHLQFFPRFLRFYPDDGGIWGKFIFLLWLALRLPKEFFRRLRDHVKRHNMN